LNAFFSFMTVKKIKGPVRNILAGSLFLCFVFAGNFGVDEVFAQQNLNLTTELTLESESSAEVTKKENVDVTGVTSAADEVIITTNMGNITVKLFTEQAPVTVANFLKYVADGFYDGLLFHRVIYNFMIQGGGFDQDLNIKNPTYPPIINESSNGLLNYRGTIAMARTVDPNSATSQFYINLRDNKNLNFEPENPTKAGYTVFGEVTAGMDVVDKISRMDIVYKKGMRDVPKQNVVIESIRAK